MTQDNGTPAPTAFELFAQTEKPSDITTDKGAATGTEQKPARSPDDARIDAITAKVTELDAAIDAAETGRQRRELIAQRDALTNEKAKLQIRDILSAPEQESAPNPDASTMNATKDGWRIDVPDTFSPSLTPLAKEYGEDMGRAAHDAGIPADEANALFEFVSQHAAGQLPELNIANEREVLNHMRNTYGATEAAAIVAAAQDAFKKLPKSVQAYLDAPNDDNTRLTNSPSVLLMLALWGSGHTRLTPEAATKELARLRASKEYVAGHKLTLEKARLLQTMLSRKSRAATAAPKTKQPAPAPASGIEKRIKELRTHPAYLDKSHASHKEVVQQVSDLFAQRAAGGR